MQHFTSYPDFYNRPIRIKADADMTEILKTFFLAHSLAEIRQRLWNMLEVCLATDNDHFQTGEQRANVFYFYAQMEEVLEAAFMLFGTGRSNKK